MPSRAATEWRYEKLTWPEINDAVELGKVCILPCSAVEQHGPHLPLDVDVVCPTEIARGVGRLIPDKMLLLPTYCYGYTGHVMDYPGTINTHFEHFIDGVLDIAKSLAYHGFKKIILLNGHGSNWPNLDLVARRANLETDAECVPICWWSLLTVDKDFLPGWRQSKFPGGCARVRAGDVTVSVSGRRQRAQGPDQKWHDLVQRGGEPIYVGQPLRRRACVGDLLDQQLLRNRCARRGGARDSREGSNSLTRKPSNSSCGSSRGSKIAPRMSAAIGIAQRRRCQSPGAKGRSRRSGFSLTVCRRSAWHKRNPRAKTRQAKA